MKKQLCLALTLCLLLTLCGCGETPAADQPGSPTAAATTTAAIAPFYGKWKVEKLLVISESYNDASEYPTGQDILGNEIVIRVDHFDSTGLAKYPVYQANVRDPYYKVLNRYYDGHEFCRQYKTNVPEVDKEDTVTVIHPCKSETVDDIPMTLLAVNNDRLILLLEASYFELTRIGD